MSETGTISDKAKAKLEKAKQLEKAKLQKRLRLLFSV